MTTPPELFTRLQDALGAQYRLERELGRGGMGVVYLATDTALDRRVAVKVVHPELAAHPNISRRFLAEARMIARLRHPNIVTVHAAGSADGLLWYVMDDVPGETLRQRLLRERRLPAAEASRIVSDLALALHAAWRAGLIHRDVKPENVLLDSASGRALLADFGIARAAAGDENATTTGRGVAVGTPAYMSPEQAAGEEIDGRSDLYALGIVAYEMLAGRPPFEGPGRVIVSKHLAERPVPIDRVRSDCPAPLAAAIMRALEKSPAERWQTGDEFRRAVEGTVVARRRPARRRLVAALAGAALFIAGATVTLAGRGRDAPPPDVDPRRSILILPFENLRDDAAAEWLREGSVSMLGLNLSQWNDLAVVDYERLRDLLRRHGVKPAQEIGLDLARRMARDAGVWTVVLGDFRRAGDSLFLAARVYDVATGRRVDLAEIAGPTADDVRPLFDQLANRLLDLSGAPDEIRTGLAQATTQSLDAYRAYLRGVERLSAWELGPAVRELEQAVALDSTFGLAYYKLALARGWVVGADDSVSDAAMLRARQYSRGLPDHDRTVIAAYHAFIQQNYALARNLYGQLIGRDAADPDAWYGLGEAWFHDEADSLGPTRWTESLRAFRRTIELDRNYTLAYDHVRLMLVSAAQPRPMYALEPGDSFVAVRTPDGRARLDSARLAAAVSRARDAAVGFARDWVANQPTTARAHSALVDAYLAAGDYNAALGEVARFRAAAPTNPELPFVEARIRFAAGEVDRAAEGLRQALDSLAPQDFDEYEGTASILWDIAAAANVFAYQGDLVHAAQAIDLADQVQHTVWPANLVPGDGLGMGPAWRRAALAELYSSVGAPEASLRRLWNGTAEEVRTAPAEERKELAHAGASAAIGLLSGVAGDTTAVRELEALTGEAPPREVRALLALYRRDSTAARRALSEPDPKRGLKPAVANYRQPLAAQAHFELGDYRTALELLESFEAGNFSTRGFDARWGMLARVRLLRAAAYEKLGRAADAAREYRLVLSQWKGADPALQPFREQAQRGLGRLLGEG